MFTFKVGANAPEKVHKVTADPPLEKREEVALKLRILLAQKGFSYLPVTSYKRLGFIAIWFEPETKCEKHNVESILFANGITVDRQNHCLRMDGVRVILGVNHPNRPLYQRARVS